MLSHHRKFTAKEHHIGLNGALCNGNFSLIEFVFFLTGVIIFLGLNIVCFVGSLLLRILDMCQCLYLLY